MTFRRTAAAVIGRCLIWTVVLRSLAAFHAALFTLLPPRTIPRRRAEERQQADEKGSTATAHVTMMRRMLAHVKPQYALVSNPSEGEPADAR